MDNKNNQTLEFNSIFEIIGPRMVGPSSSHTAGAARIGGKARALFDEQKMGILKEMVIYLYGSFSTTYKGHATDVALIGGVLGLEAHDLQIKDAFELAAAAGVSIHIKPVESGEIPVDREKPLGENNPHPNTAKLELVGSNGTLTVTGVSIGGGSYKIIDVN